MAEILMRPQRPGRNPVTTQPASPRELTLKTLTFLLKSVPSFILSFADAVSVPTGASVAYGAALAAAGEATAPAALGILAAFGLRFLWALPVRWEFLIAAVTLLILPRLTNRRPPWVLLACTAGMLLPGAILGLLAGSFPAFLRGMGATAIGTLSMPVLYRAIRAIDGGRAMDALEDRLAVGWLTALLLCGGARMMLLVNVGILGAALVTLLSGMTLGVGVGSLLGILCGVALSLQGLPLVLGICLALGGFLAGMAQALGRRVITCTFFAVSCTTSLLLTGATEGGAVGAAVLVSIGVMLLPRAKMEQMEMFLRRFLSRQISAGDAYAAWALNAWERTVEEMAEAVPSPLGREETRNGAWWEERLCAGCPERENCGCMAADLGVNRVEKIWAHREDSDESWDASLEELRGLGCSRLYLLRENMNLLRAEDAEDRRKIRLALEQREMLVTHLTALAGAARRFAALSSGASWWDDLYARRIRRLLAEKNVPAQLSFVRQVGGHLQAAYELHCGVGAREQSKDLCERTSELLGKPMRVAELTETRVRLTELPLYTVEVGSASACFSSAKRCGDTVCLAELADGRFLAALSDGMGHGDQAAMESRQTVDLLRLCLDAGYDRAQTLTAVNGMMLLAGRGERFSTVDLLLVDLWTGRASLDKMGAAASWLMQEDGLRMLTGDALPLGIVENVQSRAQPIRLRPGDALILLSDGVEDAFDSYPVLEDVLRQALEQPDVQAAADLILDEVGREQEGLRRDDQTAIVLRFVRTAGMTPD